MEKKMMEEMRSRVMTRLRKKRRLRNQRRRSLKLEIN